MSTPQKVVLLACGSFNPPTNMHLRMFELARDFLQRSGKYNVIAGIMSPVSDGYNKKDLAPAKHRCNMVNLALKSSKWIRLDRWECEQPSWLETEKVLSHHKQILDNQANTCIKATPSKKRRKDKRNEDELDRNNEINTQRNNREDTENVQLKLLCGGDLLESFSVPGLWKDEDIEKIVLNYGLVCITRNGSDPRKFIYESDVLTKHQDNIHIVTEWIQNEISSTKIRRALRRRESVKYLLQDSVIEYIRENELYGYTSDNKYSENSTINVDIMDFVDGGVSPDVPLVTTLETQKSPFKAIDRAGGSDFEAPKSPRRHELGRSSPANVVNSSPKRFVDGDDDDASKTPPHQPCLTDIGTIVRRVRNIYWDTMKNSIRKAAADGIHKNLLMSRYEYNIQGIFQPKKIQPK